MAGIYIHIPFCLKKCGYCDFYKETDISKKGLFVENLLREIVQRKLFFEDNKVDTIYFGGGTPSVLNEYELEIIIKVLFENFSFADDIEITLEANPDDIDESYARVLEKSYINRISLGTQSFSDIQLRFMNRRHNAAQAISAINILQNHGFNNISIDLIYGLPVGDFDVWKENVNRAISLNVQHISAYHLTYEEGTPFYLKLKSGEFSEMNDEESVKQFNYLRAKLIEADFIHYELSNFSKVDFESKHNSSYWNGEKYLGLGPSAHSFDGDIRRWNNSSLIDYLGAFKNDIIYFQEEVLSMTDKYNEFVMLGLRTLKGVNLKKLNSLFDEHCKNYFFKIMNKKIEDGSVFVYNNYLMIKSESKFITDSIIEEFIIV